MSESAIRQRALSVPLTCWDIPMPQKMIAFSARANLRATVRNSSASMPQTGAISSGVKGRICSAKAAKPSTVAWTYCSS